MGSKHVFNGAVAISVLVVLIFGAVMGAALLKIADTSSPGIQMLMGALIGAFTTTVQYWLGSSSGSAKKDQDVANQVAALSPPPVPVIPSHP